MKKELALHFITLIILFIVISLFKAVLTGQISYILSFWPFWLGGIIGTILPDVDHIIYVYYLRPYEVTSQRVMQGVQSGNLWQSWNLLSETRGERTNLILHSVVFQILFVVLSFLVLSSSGNLLGKGLVVAFLLHLFVDEILDLRAIGNLTNWFKQIPIQLDNTQLNIYLITNAVIILFFGFLL
jgi:hypothetical protein